MGASKRLITSDIQHGHPYTVALMYRDNFTLIVCRTGTLKKYDFSFFNPGRDVNIVKTANTILKFAKRYSHVEQIPNYVKRYAIANNQHHLKNSSYYRDLVTCLKNISKYGKINEKELDNLATFAILL